MMCLCCVFDTAFHIVPIENPKDAMLRDFQKQIEDLKRQLEENGGGCVFGCML